MPRRTGDLAASMRATTAHMPGHWMFLPIAKGKRRRRVVLRLMESSADVRPISAPITLDSWIRAGNGDASGFWLQSVLSRLTFGSAGAVWGDKALIAREEATRPASTSPRRTTTRSSATPGRSSCGPAAS